MLPFRSGLGLCFVFLLCVSCQGDSANRPTQEPGQLEMRTQEPRSVPKPALTPLQVQGLPTIPPEATTDPMGARSDPAWAAFLVQPGDLPALQKAGENLIVAGDHPPLGAFPGAVFQVTQWLDRVEQDGEIGGHIIFTMYDTVVAAQQDYKRLSLNHGDTLNDVGEEARIEQESREGTTTYIVFRRCRATIMISGIWQLDPTKLRGAFSKESVLKYAQRLDEHIRPIIC